MGHNVGKAAENAVNKSKKTALEDRTPEQIIKGIRLNLAAKLAVTGDDMRFLLAQYDAAIKQNAVLTDTINSQNHKIQILKSEAALATGALARIKELEDQEAKLLADMGKAILESAMIAAIDPVIEKAANELIRPSND